MRRDRLWILNLICETVRRHRSDFRQRQLHGGQPRREKFRNILIVESCDRKIFSGSQSLFIQVLIDAACDPIAHAEHRRKFFPLQRTDFLISSLPVPVREADELRIIQDICLKQRSLVSEKTLAGMHVIRHAADHGDVTVTMFNQISGDGISGIFIVQHNGRNVRVGRKAIGHDCRCLEVFREAVYESRMTGDINDAVHMHKEHALKNRS